MCTVHVTPSSSPAASGPCRQSQTRGHARVHRKTTSRRRRSTNAQQPPSHTQSNRGAMAAATGNTGWAQLRQQARSLETQVRYIRSERHPGFPDIRPPQTETLFHTYSQFSTVSDIPAKPTEEERTTEAKLQDLLEKVRSSPCSKDLGSDLLRCLERPY